MPSGLGTPSYEMPFTSVKGEEGLKVMRWKRMGGELQRYHFTRSVMPDLQVGEFEKGGVVYHGRRDMVPETAMLIISDDEERLLPKRPVAQRFIHLLDQTLTYIDVRSRREVEFVKASVGVWRE